jgi:thiol-disulfide isomerase/thioredoxin
VTDPNAPSATPAKVSPAKATSTATSNVAFVLALLVIAGAGGFVSYRLLGKQASSLTPIQYSGSPRSPTLPAESDGSATTREVPEQLPDLAMPDSKGIRHKLSQWRGRPLMVNFWATWCPPCRREIPLLKSLWHERSSQSLEIVGIAVDSQDAVAQYTQKIGIDYPVLIGEKDGIAAIDALGMETVFPLTVFVDPQGRIFMMKVGELHRDEANVILDALRDVDSGKVDIEVARKKISTEIAKLNAGR